MTRIGCNMHGRRGFEKAFKEVREVRPVPGSEGLRVLQTPLRSRRAREERMRGQGRPGLARASVKCPLPPKSQIGKAFQYFCAEYERLTGYLRDGGLEMDNGTCNSFWERAMRKLAIGRKNWLFSGTPGDSTDGANASSVLYSFVVTAKLNGVNPYEALRKIFDQRSFCPQC
jgi:hypothetical protein